MLDIYYKKKIHEFLHKYKNDLHSKSYLIIAIIY
jgi:hypothetical protein